MSFFDPLTFRQVANYAAMADSAYVGRHAATINGWTTSLPKSLGSIVENGFYFRGPQDSEAKVFYRNGEITIAICGSNSSTDVIYVDRQIRNGSYPKSYTEYFKPLIDKVLQVYGKDVVINLTGHSLGGAVVNDMVARQDHFGIKNLGDATAFSSPYIVDNPHVRNYGADNDPVFEYLKPKADFTNTADHLHYIGDGPKASEGADPHTQTDPYSAHRLLSLRTVFDRIGQSQFDDKMGPDSNVYALGFNRVYTKPGYHVFDAGAPGNKYNTYIANQKSEQTNYILGVDVTRQKYQQTHDFLMGGKGVDHIEGFSGNDVLIGGPGRDFMVGGRGNDYFVAMAGDKVYAGIGHDVVELRGTDVKVKPENDAAGNGPKATNAVDFVFNKDGGHFNWATYVKNMNDTDSRGTLGSTVNSISFEYDASKAPSARLTLDFNQLSDRKHVVSFYVADGDKGKVKFVGGGDADHNNTLVFRDFGKSDNRFVFSENKYSAVYQDIDKVVMKQIDVVLKKDITDFSPTKLKNYTSDHRGDWVLSKTSDDVYTAFHVTSTTGDASDLVKSASFVNLHLSELEI